MSSVNGYLNYYLIGKVIIAAKKLNVTIVVEWTGKHFKIIILPSI